MICLLKSMLKNFDSQLEFLESQKGVANERRHCSVACIACSDTVDLEGGVAFLPTNSDCFGF